MVTVKRECFTVSRGERWNNQHHDDLFLDDFWETAVARTLNRGTGITKIFWDNKKNASRGGGIKQLTPQNYG